MDNGISRCVPCKALNIDDRTVNIHSFSILTSRVHTSGLWLSEAIYHTSVHGKVC